MKRRLLIIFSAALNVALAAAIFLHARKAPPPIPVVATPAPVAAIVPSEPPAEVPVTGGLPFHWDKIVSADLKVYRDNLRAIGCPELTVREIIRAVINQLFGARRREILTAFQGQYWDMVGRGELNRRQAVPRTEWGQALASLTTERQSTITDVLGREAGPTEAERKAQQMELEQRLSWLPADKRGRLMALEEKRQQRLDDWFESIRSKADGAPTPEDRDRLAASQNEFDAAEKQLLTPGEMAELQLRQSDAADWASSLPGFNPSQEQWRSLTELRSQYEAAASADPSSQNQLQENFDDAVKGLLDPDSFAQFQLANNDQYQSIHSVTERYGLPDSVAAQSLDVQQAAQAQADQIRADPNLSPDDEQAALSALQQQTQQSLEQILGANVLSTYKEYGGDWLNGLSQPNK